MGMRGLSGTESEMTRKIVLLKHYVMRRSDAPAGESKLFAACLSLSMRQIIEAEDSRGATQNV